MNTAQMLIGGLDLQLPENLSSHVQHGLDTTCAITGDRITSGIPWKRVIPSSTGEYLDLMHGMTFEYLSVDAAAAYKGSWNLGNRMIFEDGAAYHPYISADSAAKSDRVCWSALVRDIWPMRRGQKCVCIITDDFKKRIWPRATVGEIGVNTPVLLYDSGRFTLRNLTINWKRLIEVLDFTEEVYGAGFSKEAIGNGLYLHYAAFVENAKMSIGWEARLETIRQIPEFSIVLLIAQKGGRSEE